jgi:hypothetical protein
MKYLKKNILPFVILICTMFFLTTGFATTTISYNAAQLNQNVVVPFGANMLTPTTSAQISALQTLFQFPGFRMARINSYETNDGLSTPLSGTIATYQNWWATYGPGEVHGPTAPVDVGATQYLFLIKIPTAFMQSDGEGGKELITGVDLQSLANYMAAGVQHFNSTYGSFSDAQHPIYVEISNEPNGDWTVELTTAQYNTLVKELYTGLQSLGITNALITGPGVGNIDWKTNGSYGTDTYVKALDATALSNIGAWSVHQYVYSTYNNLNFENIDAGSAVNGYGQTAARFFLSKWKPTTATKPIIVSEYATKATGFHNIIYSAPNAAYACMTPPLTNSNCTIINTTSYGVRMYTYMISLLTGGAYGALYWEAIDEAATGEGWGLLDYNLNKRTNYYAMQPLWTYIPANSTVLTSPTTQNGNDIYSAVFLTPYTGKVNCIVIALANGTGNKSTISRTTTVTNLPLTAKGFTANTLLFSQLGSTVYQGQLTTDPHSTFSLKNGVLTHNTTMANDTTVTAQVCLTY